MKKLPIEYQEVEYIESTGTQYIDTGVNAKSGDKIRIATSLTFTATTGTQNNGIYGGAYFGINNDKFSIGGVTKIIANADTNKHSYDFEAEIGTNKTLKLSFDGTSYSGVRTTAAGNIYLFGVNSTSTFLAKQKLYFARIYLNDVLVRNMIPCKNTNGVIGLYDVIGNQFYENLGTGSFLKGNAIYYKQKFIAVTQINNTKQKFITITKSYILPDEYQQVEYIHSTHTNLRTAYIDTNYYPNETTDVEADCIFRPQLGVTTFIFGEDDYVQGRGRIASFALGNGTASDITRLTGTRGSQSFYTPDFTWPSTRTRYSIKDKKLYINDTAYITFDSTKTFTATKSLTLFTAGYSDATRSTCDCDMYRFKIWNNGVLVRNLIPCYRKSDSVAGMYDLVTKTFYTNAGTGVFTKGNNVYHKQKFIVVTQI